MKIYTVQNKHFLNNEPIKPKKSKNSIFTNTVTIKALNFMKRHYRKDCPDLIWVWPQFKYIDFEYFDKDEVLFVFEVPKSEYKKILWSDYMEWHMPLNDYYGDEFSIDNLFNVNPLKAKGKVIQGVTDHLKKEWLVKIIKK